MKHSGAGIIEMLVVVAITSILIATITPSLSKIIEYSKATSEIARLYQSLQYARSLSKSYRSRITVCPLQSGSCSADWNSGFSIFNDKNNNGVFDSGEILVLKIAIDAKDFLSFPKTKISFNDLGQAGFSNGTMRFCSQKLNSEYPQQLVIATSGRIKRQDDKNLNCDD
ncbi:GspH/FimT family pseudopilin [Paraferrimonas sp. SM1919]|uniref:GspH/FimT family pseudopilin n=1 Tax=Paraferrimonas sp. SM1919 TaxID=2662263 RepID=UPI0013CFF014|nr:GspH/FimT family pseudopilin [Paraferrimonas sp. SM1919]